MKGVRIFQFKQHREEFICRIPGLFPYIGYESDGTPRLYPATASPNGSYGQVMPDVVYEVTVTQQVVVGGVITTETKTETVVMPYNTVMNLYRESKVNGGGVNLIAAIDEMIGKVETASEILENPDYPEAPDYIYLALVPQIIDEYAELKRFYDVMKANKIPKSHDSYQEACCKAAKYVRMGGDKFYNSLSKLLKEREKRASAFYERTKQYLDKECEGNLNRLGSTCFSINLSASFDNLGTVTPLVLAWNPGEKLEKGDTTVYDNASWIAREATSGHYDTATREILFEDGTSGTLQKMDRVGTYAEYLKHMNNISAGDETVADNAPLFTDIGFNPMFDETSYNVKYCQWASSQVDESGSTENTESSGDGEDAGGGSGNSSGVGWNTGSGVGWNTGSGSVIGGSTGHDPAGGSTGTTTQQPGLGDIDVLYDKYLNITGTTDSKLSSLRWRQYTNTSHITEMPDKDVDWLTNYREGYAVNVEVQRDENDNIAFLDDDRPNVGDDVKNLCAYGDIITYIGYGYEDGIITFEYTMGAHLKAVLSDIQKDRDGNDIYIYSAFTVDEDKDSRYGYNVGVRYVETHRALFGAADTDLLDYDQYLQANNRYNKLPFEVVCTSMRVSYQNRDYYIDSVRADYECSVAKWRESLLHVPIIRQEHLIGTAYAPKLDIDVNIERGNAAAFERFLKLAEVKTFEDLECYGNYGFFNLK